MHRKIIFALSIALGWYAALGSSSQARAVNSQSSSQSADNSSATGDEGAVAQMVPAAAVLAQDLDTKKLQPGEQFKATLSDTVHLKNGVELPRGTELEGTVAKEGTPDGAKTALALRFTQANVKGGKAIPIEATIVGVAPPYDNLSVSSNEEAPPTPWNGQSRQIDVNGVLSGVDLHSRIGGEDSGVFVSPTKSSMKLTARTQMALAICAQGASMANGGL
jgi:hypothetical protein